MSSSADSWAATRAVFRVVNEQIRTLSERFDVNDINSYVCECGNMDCRKTVEMSRAEFDSIRSQPERFVIALNHEQHRDNFAVVETRPNRAFRIAEAIR